jgi:hypothetical protein
VRDGRLERLAKYASDLPPALGPLVKQSLARRVDDRFQSAAEFRDALGDLLFRARLRVSPGDLGRIAADFLDKSPEALGRAREQLKDWKMPTTLLGDPPPPAPPTASTPTPAATADSTAAQLRPASPAPLAAASADTPELAVAVEEHTGPRKVEKPKREQYKMDARMAAALDNLMTSPMTTIDLDMYQALTPAPGQAPPLVSSPIMGPGMGVPSWTPRPPALPVAEITGELNAITPMRMFSDLAVSGETGLLRFEIPHVSEVYLVRGAPESLGSQLGGQRFGEYLASRGVLRADEVKVALAQVHNFEGKIVDAIIGLGILQPVEVFRLLSEQVRQRVIEIFGFSQGQASFYRNLRNSNDSFPLGLDPFEILGAGVLTLPALHLQQRFVALHDLRPRACDPPRLSLEAFRLGPTPRELWGMLDGGRTVREWLMLFQNADEQLTFLRTLYLLLETGLASLG